MKKFRIITDGIIVLLSVTFLFIFIAPFIYSRILHIGNITGILICLLLIFKFGFKKKYQQLKELFCKHKTTKILWKVYSVCGIVFTVYAILVSSLMIGFSMCKPAENATAVVLGAQVKNTGPSVSLLGRIYGAKDYLDNNPESVAVVTGGQGEKEPMTEAECMYENLVALGFDEERIYLEDKATDTFENIKYSIEIIEKNNLDDNLAIATDSYHQFRARVIALKLGVKSKIGAVNAENISFYSTIIYPTHFVREWFAIPAEILF